MNTDTTDTGDDAANFSDPKATTIEHDANPTWAIDTLKEATDLERSGRMQISKETGGLEMKDYRDAMEFAKMMATSKLSIPAHLQGNASDCLMIISRAMWWRLDPVFVAEHSYNSGNGRMSFDSSVFHAVLSARRVCQGLIRCRYAGKGDARTCTVYAIPRGETEVIEHTSPPIVKLLPPFSDKPGMDKVRKGSPLWDKNPDQQLFYHTVRDFARKYFPHVLGGIYDREEFEETNQDHIGPDNAKDVSPNLMNRLPGRMTDAGFQNGNVSNGLRGRDKPKDDDKPAGDQQEPAKDASKPAPDTKTADKAKPARKTPERDWQAKPPKTPKEYQLYLKGWLEVSDTPSDIVARFNKERSIRNNANMVKDDTDECRALMQAKIEKL